MRTASSYGTRNLGFGKTLSVYDLCKCLDAVKVLIVTNRPAIANSWYEDYCKFIGVEGGYRFVSTVDAIKDRPLVMTREEYLKKNSPTIMRMAALNSSACRI